MAPAAPPPTARYVECLVAMDLKPEALLFDSLQRGMPRGRSPRHRQIAQSSTPIQVMMCRGIGRTPVAATEVDNSIRTVARSRCLTSPADTDIRDRVSLDWLRPYQLQFVPAGEPGPAFPSPDPVVQSQLVELWAKYAHELVELTRLVAIKQQKMQSIGLSCAFNDFEGELLYVLIRELRPDLIYEISPNSGYSTNYLLAAVTKNGLGRIEGFEVIDKFDGKPTATVIESNLVTVCDPARYHLNVGDARRIALDRLRQEQPSFTLLDSCHEDFFAEFYVKALLPRLCGTVVIQDVAHYDPRPEWSSEAYYLLTHFQLTGTRYVLAASYEDQVDAAGVRQALAPRRPYRSSSVILNLGDSPRKSADQREVLLDALDTQDCALDLTFPLTAAARAGRRPSPPPESGTDDLVGDRYVAAYHGERAHEGDPTLCDLIAVTLRRAPRTEAFSAAVAARFAEYDPCSQVLAIECLSWPPPRPEVGELIGSIDLDRFAGSDLLVRLARAALVLGKMPVADAAIERARAAAIKGATSTAARNLIELAGLAIERGQMVVAKRLCGAALETARRQEPNGRAKYEREIAAFAFEHPTLLPTLARSGLGPRLYSGAVMFARAKALALAGSLRGYLRGPR